MFSVITSILIFLVVLSVLVLVHELGHYLVAKKAGIWVEEFGFGIPPRIYGKKVGETIYSINLLPFGGFVRLHGESPTDEVTNKRRSFMNKSKKVRLAVLAAGVTMNFLLAIVAFAVVYSFTGTPRETKDVKIVEIDNNSPAKDAGILVGDIVKKVDNTDITNVNQFVQEVDQVKGKKVQLEVQRIESGNQVIKNISLTPRENPPAGEGPMGVAISTTEIYFPPIYQRPFVGIYYGFKEAIFWGQTVIVGLFTILGQLFSGKVPQDVSGPIGIYAITSEAAKMGSLSLLEFLGILSVNLAILNFVPFPALDGGRVLFLGIEAVLGKKILPKVEATLNTAGMLILIILIIAITARDIQRLVKYGGIEGFLNSISSPK